ncbi:hypothetical protein H6G89_19665 [Oscillatoria sp. FACHB-1407]|uniref:hypothetical protein n=1 Tax=Oscillatoria sp. FACHB-1407 TaxID=2692847 RepID=UPI001685EDB9|nr:hypothetical protein [Oscillatoria sp. FACHB-1407]MBD2463256.1 hypothetical protein [Oscillatoria sp. FACHB-1407]
MSWEPGNPKGWGDPAPIVLAVLLLVIAGAAVDNFTNVIAERDRCEELLNSAR